MKFNKLLSHLLLLLIFSSCKGHEKPEDILRTNPKDTVESFIIGQYMLVPKLKEVRAYKMTGGVNWDGYKYEKDPGINYDKTTLLVGTTVMFKEYFPFSYNLDNLKAIYSDEFWSMSRDDKNIYYTSQRIKPTNIYIGDYTPVNDFIYKAKDGALFFIDIEAYKLSPVTINIDENSIKHLRGNYYADKNGLYIFGVHYKKNQKGSYDTVDKSEKLAAAQNVVPVVSKKYISFANEVFAMQGSRVKKLDLDAKKIIEINFSDKQSFITDGKSIYTDLNYGYEDKNEKGYYGTWYPDLFSGVKLQQIYSPLLHFLKEKNSVVFNKNDPNNFPGLVAVINNENFILDNKTKTKIGKTLFYHPETKTTEAFDVKYLKIFTAERFIQYKNVLYFEQTPVETSKLDLKNLREIKNSNYLTDGKAIFYIGFVTGLHSKEINGVEYALFNDRIIENAFTNEMKVLNPDLLSDGITIINKGEKITIKDLNLNVKVVK
ncbi:hypothetical protein [Flavobacterium hungaricum]|uniref:Lipoprotein n=1 Tax=Flavobacterium hungaricum TaxID=2082725 RepID=A0ABR9TEG8_9FLAO|nr:hypothetical protein [Flavobacterium hungaricum]MBE8723681.1 hypothetical protein [Flavobacterium hungaricum]